LKEGLESLELFNSNDPKIFECIALYFLKRNKNSNKFVNIEDIMNEININWETLITKINLIEKS
jgi:hypothetical protein